MEEEEEKRAELTIHTFLSGNAREYEREGRGRELIGWLVREGGRKESPQTLEEALRPLG